MTPQQVFLKNFQTLKERLIDDNYTNIKNLNLSNHNFNQIFTYLNKIIRLQQRVTQLQQAIRQMDINHPVLMKKIEQRQTDFRQTSFKLQNFVPLAPKIAENFTSKFISPMMYQQKKSKKTLNGDRKQQNYLEQSLLISTFIQKQLKFCIVEDPTKNSSIPKDIILALYLRWNEIDPKKLSAEELSSIKQLLARQIGQNYPNTDNCQTFYRGISFRQDLRQDIMAKDEILASSDDENKFSQGQLCSQFLIQQFCEDDISFQ